MNRKYVVKLGKADRRWLEGVVRRGCDSAAKIARARILLKSEFRTGGWSAARISEALEVSISTVERVRKRFSEGGVKAAVERLPQPDRPQKRRFDGVAEARLVTLACSTPPEGRDRWTLDLLADHMVKLHYVGLVSRCTVHRTLKKTS
jgi:transposase